VKDSALCLIGDGLGNLIEQSTLPQAAAAIFRDVDVWCPRSTDEHVSVLHGMPGVRNVWAEPHHFRNIRHAGGEIYYDAVFQTFLLAGRYGHKVPCGRFYRSPNPQHLRGERQQSEGEIVMRGVREAGYVGETPPPFCNFDGWPGEVLRQGREGPVIGISTGGNPRPVWRFKRYKRYAEVVDGLIRAFPAAKLVLLGVARDDPIVHDAVLDWRGEGTLREVCGLVLTECDAFLGNDCGLCHAAAALKIPTFVVFGPTVMWKNTPRAHAVGMQRASLPCVPCQYSRHGIGRRQDGSRCQNECLAELDPRVVVQNMVPILKHRMEQT
jgi:hypothetical protein